MWRSRVFLWTDSTTGIRDEGVYNSQTGKYDKHRARSFLAASWHDDTSRYSLGGSVQKDVSNQIQSILEKGIPLDPNYTLKGELLGFYAQLEGLSRNTSQPNDTALVSGQVTWNAPWGSVFGSGGYLRHAMNGAVVDTDIGYPFSLSLDRNREGMQSWQLGVNYRLTPQFTLTFAPIVTRGYESSKRDVRIEGAGILGGMNYRVSEGPLQGMNFFLAADKGREKRDGSALGDRLNYWDVKMSIPVDMATEFMTQVAKLEGYQEDQAKKLAKQQVEGASAMGQMFRLTTLQDNTITTSLQYANGQITLNGQKMSLEDFVGMFAMPALNVPAVPAIPQQ